MFILLGETYLIVKVLAYNISNVYIAGCNKSNSYSANYDIYIVYSTIYNISNVYIANCRISNSYSASYDICIDLSLYHSCLYTC